MFDRLPELWGRKKSSAPPWWKPEEQRLRSLDSFKILPTDLRLGEQTTSEIQPRNLSKFTRPIGTRTAILSRLIEAEDQSGTVTRGKPSWFRGKPRRSSLTWERIDWFGCVNARPSRWQVVALSRLQNLSIYPWCNELKTRVGLAILPPL